MTATSGRLLTAARRCCRRGATGPASELADRLEVSGRTIRRDVERLRELGYPVDALTGPGRRLPAARRHGDAAAAARRRGGGRDRRRAAHGRAAPAVTGHRGDAVRALVKLEQVLPAHLRRRVSALAHGDARGWPRSAARPSTRSALTVLAAACRDRERLRFAYRRATAPRPPPTSSRTALVNLGRRWYLVAWDCEREDWRTFRARPPGAARARRARASRRASCPASDPAAFVAANLRGAPYRYAGARHAARPGGGDARALRRACGARSSRSPSTLRVPHERRLARLARAADRRLGVEFEVHEPPELAERCRELGARLARGRGVADQSGAICRSTQTANASSPISRAASRSTISAGSSSDPTGAHSRPLRRMSSIMQR